MYCVSGGGFSGNSCSLLRMVRNLGSRPLAICRLHTCGLGLYVKMRA